MSTRSGPYDVDVAGEEWAYEHDSLTDRVDDDYGDVFRVYGPGVYVEMALQQFDELSWMIPLPVANAIRAAWDLPHSYALEHARLWSRGEECAHCPKRYTS